MLHLGKAGQRCRAHPLGRRVGRDQLRVRRLQCLQLTQQPVILRIRNRWLIEHIVIVVVLLDGLAQPPNLLRRLGSCWWLAHCAADALVVFSMKRRMVAR